MSNKIRIELNILQTIDDDRYNVLCYHVNELTGISCMNISLVPLARCVTSK